MGVLLPFIDLLGHCLLPVQVCVPVISVMPRQRGLCSAGEDSPAAPWTAQVGAVGITVSLLSSCKELPIQDLHLAK